MAGADPKSSRGVTDTKLRIERDRADEELLERSTALGENADEVIRRARDRARLVLELARQREDSALDRTDAGARERGEVADARRVADDMVAAEYADADAAIFDERSQRRRALIQLLALERDDTDRVLSSERHIADRLVAVRDDTLGAVSHDLRNHLSSMLVRVSLALSTKLRDAELAQDMRAVMHSIGQMEKLVEDLLDVATMDAGRMRIEPAPTDLVRVVMDEVEIHRPAAAARSIQLTVDAGRSPVMVQIDPTPIGRVLTNVIGNAIKFTPPGGCVEVSLQRQADAACISVKDTGPGIEADQLETVFERFRRADTGTRGYGLGLYIARAIVDAHRGRIWVESKAGEGATFHICVPSAISE